MPDIENLLMPSTYLQLMARAVDDVDRLLEGTNLTPALLAESSAITVKQQFRCIRNSRALMRRPDWHLAWARRVSERFHGPISLAQLSAPTLGDGVDVFARYMPTRVPHMRWRARLGTEKYSLTITPRMALGDLAPILFEIPLLSLVSYINTVRAGNIAGLVVELGHKPLVKLAEYRRWYGCEFRFNESRNAVVIPATWRSLSNVGHDQALWQAALRQCRAAAWRSSADSDGVDAKVRAALFQCLTSPGGNASPPSLDAMARQLNFSSRTLSRRLVSAGVSYQQLLDEVRQKLSRELLEEGWRVGDVAQAMGFANTGSFDRAFLRWYGTAPRKAVNRREKS